MVPLTGLDEHPLVHALGWTLLHFCWQGAIVAGMLWCVLGLLGGRSSQARYLASCAAMLLLVTLPLFTFARIAADEYHTRSAAHRLAAALNFDLFLQVNVGGAAPPWPVRFALALDRFLPWLLAAWLLGALFFVVRLNFGLIVARRLRSVGIESPNIQLQQSFDALRQRAGVARAVRLFHSAKVQVPTVVGWLRPVVLIPASCLTGLSTDQIEAILCHELAHVRRHDYLVSVFQSLAEALLFYHPAVWWVSRQLRRERECCCDELALAHGGDALEYARALSYLEERRAAFPEFVLGANGGVLTMRIKRLLGCSNNAGAPQFAVLLLLALIATISASYATTLARAQKATAVSAIAPSSGSAVAPGQSSANPSTAQPLRGIYRIWLQQDVRWIITPQESDAFLRLQNDNERDAFISSFWSRRDPPGSGNGNYREAYYARMAYANQHFASNTRVGWSTDRGHVYLLYGKPDSIEAHPGGGEYPTKDGSQSLSYPFEIWHYQHLAGIGDNVGLVFVDSCRCGNYNYTVDHPGQTGAAAPQAIPLASRLFTASRVSFPPTGSVVPQAGDSTIAGIVFDKTGAVIARASVKATSSDGSFEIATRTGADGRYSLASLPAGRYTIEAAARGFDNLIQQDVPVEKSQQLGLNLKLKVGAVQENMTVVAPAAAPPVVASIALPPPPAPEQSGKPTGPIRVSSGTMAGAVIKKVDPIYPPDAKASHVSGTVVLRATISKLGTIENLEVVSGPPILIMSAVDAVKQWVYKPYLLNGEPTEVATTININYTFGESDPPADTTASASGDLQVRKIGDGVSVPLPIYIVDAQYSPEARAAQFSGVVLVGLVVDPQGLPRDVHVVRSVGMGLDERAVEAVRQYRFRPAMEHNKPVPAALNVEVNFRSDNKPDAISKSAGAAVAASRVTLPDGASAPVLIHSVEPEFTEEARKAKLMGVVLVNFTVDRRGRPQNVHVLRGVGHGLDGKAVEAVRQYRFKPAMKDSQPVEEALNVEVNFQIF